MDEKIESIKSQMNDLKETNLTHPSETQEVVDTMKDVIMEYLQGDFIKSIDETNQKTSNYIIAQVSEQV
jgi:anion-transporting  ArsA/GET3 family ATPase